jgi:hypothetical protein
MAWPETARSRPERAVREHLEELRAEGLDFETAWQIAVRGVKLSLNAPDPGFVRGILLDPEVIHEWRCC